MNPTRRTCARTRGRAAKLAARASAFILFASAAIALPTAATTAEEPVPGRAAKVGFASPWFDAWGCTPVIVTATSPVDDRLTLTATSKGSHATMVVTLRAGEPTRATLLMPPGAGGAVEMSWSLDSGLSDQESVRPRKQHRELDLAVVDGGDSGEVASIGKEVSGLAHPRSGYGWSADRICSYSAGDLPDRWQAYPLWTAVLVAANEDERLAPAQREALATWARAGGELWVCESRQLRAWSGLAAPRALDAPETAKMVEIAGVASREVTAPRNELVHRILDQINQDADPERRPVPGTEKKPTLGFVTIAMLFALIAGPLNLWYVGRRRERHLFLLTTPLLSLATCLGLACWALAADGISVRRLATQVTLLDQQAQRAHAWTNCTYFAGLSVSRLSLDRETKVAPYESRSIWGQQAEREDLMLDWRDGQLCKGAWIPARVNRQLMFSSPRPERFRLQVTKDGDGWAVANGLGVAVRDCWWRDPAGTCWSTGTIAAGASSPMRKAPRPVEASDAPADPALEDHRGLDDLGYTRGMGSDVERACRRATASPCGFFAHLSAPFGALPGPAASDPKPVDAWVCGIAAPEGAP